MPCVKTVVGKLENMKISEDSSDVLKELGSVELRYVVQPLKSRILKLNEYLDEPISNIKGLVLQNQTIIPEKAFFDNKMLNFVIGRKIETVEKEAFNDCFFLSRFRSYSLKIVCQGAFYGCTALTEIDLS